MSAPLALDLETPVREAVTAVVAFLPRLLGFLVILVVGYLVAKLVARVVVKLLVRARFDRALERGGISKALSRSSYDAAGIAEKLVFFALFVPVLVAAIDTLGIDALREPMAAFVSLIPRILVGIVLVVLGVALAGAARRLLSGSLGGLSYGSLLANVAAGLILFGFVKAALDQVGIATVVTTALLYTALAAVAGVVIVGVGGGLIAPMQSRWERILDRADRDKQEVATSGSSQTRDRPTSSDSDDVAVAPETPSSDAPFPTAPTTSMDAPTAAYGRRRT